MKELEKEFWQCVRLMILGAVIFTCSLYLMVKSDASSADAWWLLLPFGVGAIILSASGDGLKRVMKNMQKEDAWKDALK